MLKIAVKYHNIESNDVHRPTEQTNPTQNVIELNWNNLLSAYKTHIIKSKNEYKTMQTIGQRRMHAWRISNGAPLK